MDFELFAAACVYLTAGCKMMIQEMENGLIQELHTPMEFDHLGERSLQKDC